MTERHTILCHGCGMMTDPRISWWKEGRTIAVCPECGSKIELPDPTGELWRKLGPREAPKPPDEPATVVGRGLFDNI